MEQVITYKNTFASANIGKDSFFELFCKSLVQSRDTTSNGFSVRLDTTNLTN